MFLAVLIVGIALSMLDASPVIEEVIASTSYSTDPITSWSSWQSWSHCSQTCGMGQKTRKRVCNLQRQHCNGSNEEATVCTIEPCHPIIVYRNMSSVPRMIQMNTKTAKRLIIYCYVPGVSLKLVEWTRNGEVIESGGERIAQHRVKRPVVSKRLKIQPFHRDDEGLYFCKQYDENGQYVVEVKHVRIMADPTDPTPITENTIRTSTTESTTRISNGSVPTGQTTKVIAGTEQPSDIKTPNSVTETVQPTMTGNSENVQFSPSVTTQLVTTQEVTTELVTTQEVTTQATTQQATTQQATTQQATTQQATTQQATTQRPTSKQVTTQRPTSKQVTTQRPTTKQVTTQRPTTKQVTTQQPTTKQVTTQQPTTKQVTTQQPTTKQVTTQRPTTKQVTTQRPTTKQEVTTEQPTTQVTTEEKARTQPERSITQGTAVTLNSIRIVSSQESLITSSVTSTTASPVATTSSKAKHRSPVHTTSLLVAVTPSEYGGNTSLQEVSTKTEVPGSTTSISTTSDDNGDLSKDELQDDISNDESSWIIPIAASVGALTVLALLIVGCRICANRKRAKVQLRKYRAGGGHERSTSFACCDTDKYDPTVFGLRGSFMKTGSGEHLSENHDDSGLIVYGAMGVKRSKSSNFNNTTSDAVGAHITKANGAMNADMAINQAPSSFLTVPVPVPGPPPSASSALNALDNVLTEADKEIPYFSVMSPDILMAREDGFRISNGDVVPHSDQFNPGAVRREDQPTDSDSVSGLAATVAVAMAVESENSKSCPEEEIVTGDPVAIATDSVGKDKKQESEPVLQKRESKQSSELSFGSARISVGDASITGSECSSTSNPDDDEFVSDS